MMTLQQLARELRASAEIQNNMADEIEKVMEMGKSLGPLLGIFSSSSDNSFTKPILEPTFVAINKPKVRRTVVPVEHTSEDKPVKLPIPTQETRQAIKSELTSFPPEYWTAAKRRELSRKHNVSGPRIAAMWMASKGIVNARLNRTGKLVTQEKN